MLFQRMQADFLQYMSARSEPQVMTRSPLHMQLLPPHAFDPPYVRELTIWPTDVVAEDAARALLGLLAPAWGGLGVWGPSAVRRSLEIATEFSDRAPLLEAVEKWADGAASALHRLRLANALATTASPSRSTVLSEAPDAAARCARRKCGTCLLTCPGVASR